MHGRLKRPSGVLALLLLASTTVLADSGRYSGALCQFTDDDYSGQDRNIQAFKNTSGATRLVVCPVIQQIIDGDIEFAAITASASMDESTCTLVENQWDGTWGTWTTSNVNNVGGGFNETRWGSGSGWMNASTTASFGIECDLPNNLYVLQTRFYDRAP